MSIMEKEKRFNTIYHSLVQQLYRYVYYLSGDEQLAQDVVQEVFIKYWNKMDDVSAGNEKSYLYTAAKNLYFNKVEHKKVVLKFQRQYSPSNESFSPEHILEEKEFEGRLMSAISDLSDGQREVFLMHRIDGLKYREIAARLDLSQKSVEKRMNLALRSLRTKIEEI